MTLTILGKPWTPNPLSAPGGSSSRGPHRLAAARLCDRAWLMRYVRRVTLSGEAPHLREGSAYHFALAHHYAQTAELRSPWVDTLDADAYITRVSGNKEIRERALEVVAEYRAQVFGREHIPFAVEYEVYATLEELCPDYDLPEFLRSEVVTARIDLIARRPIGDLYFVDWKTQGSRKKDGTLSAWPQNGGMFATSFQFAAQQLIGEVHARRLGEDFAGVVVERITRGTPYHTDRHPIYFGPTVLEHARSLLLNAVIREFEIIENHKAKIGIGMSGFTNDCHGTFGACDYVPLCFAEREDRPALLVREYAQRRD